jgi:phosphoglycerol transferase
LTEQLRAESRLGGFARWLGAGNNRHDGRVGRDTERERQVPAFGEGPSPGGLGGKLLWALAVGAFCAVLAVFVYGFNHDSGLRTPLAREDNFFYAGIVQTIHEDGWYEPTQALGAPHGQQLLDFPMGDNNLHFLVLRGLTLLSSDPLTVLNLHVVLAFGLIGAVTYLCLRSVGVEHWAAAVASILFAFLPYHFARATYHTFLQAYWEVPLLLPLLKWAFGGRLLRRRPLEWALIALLAVVIGTTGVYYAAMLVILLVAGAGIELLRTHRPAVLVRAVGVSAVIGAVLVVNFAPSISYHRREGVNHELAQRVPSEAEQFGLRPSLLLLPSPQHRIARLAQLGQRAGDVQEPSEGPISLGFVAGAGLVLAIGFALVSAVRGDPALPASGYLAGLSIVAILVGTKGGLSFAAALFGTQQLRTWSRISVFIGLFALAFLALRVPAVQSRLGKLPTLVVLAAVLVAGLIDQVPGKPNPRQAELEPEMVADRAFTHQLEAALPAGAMVFQIPVVRFPEEPPPGIAAGYDDLRFHILGTGKLRYSFGGLRGRKDQWQERWADAGPSATVVAAATSGFSATILDRFGYKKNESDVEAELVRLLGPPVSDRSWRNRYAWFDLRPLRRRLEEAQPGRIADLGRVVANPPFLRWSGGGLPWANVFPVARDLQPYATADVSSPAPRQVRLDGQLIVPEGGEELVSYNGQLVALAPEGESRISVPLTVEQPKSRLVFQLIDTSTGQQMRDKVTIATGLHLNDPAADVVLDLTRSWTEPPPETPPEG